LNDDSYQPPVGTALPSESSASILTVSASISPRVKPHESLGVTLANV